MPLSLTRWCGPGPEVSLESLAGEAAGGEDAFALLQARPARPAPRVLSQGGLILAGPLYI